MNELAMTAEHPSATYLDVATASQNMNALKMKHNLLIEAMSDVLKKDKDYGVIPGTGNKPTLLKPGAESLCFLFGLRPTFEVVDCIEDWDKGLFYYRYRCTLLSGDGRVVANSEGSCNSRETKYRYRNQSRKCPTCGKETIIKGKAEYGGGWLCFKKKGGCGAKFQDGAQVIEKQEVGKVENTEPFELVNTLQKMAQKRALVAAVLIGTGASQFFTQDVEDMSTITIDAEVVEVDFDATKPIDPKGKRSEVTWEQAERIADTVQTAGEIKLREERPAEPEIVKLWIDSKANVYSLKNWNANEKQRKLTLGMLEECFAGSTDSTQDRHLVSEYLTGKSSSKEITDAYILSLLDWLKPEKDDGDAYLPDSMAVKEATKIRNVAMVDAGQLPLS